MELLEKSVVLNEKQLLVQVEDGELGYNIYTLHLKKPATHKLLAQTFPCQ